MLRRPVFEMTFTAAADHIDELGHVNNAAWVRWMEEVATTHWRSVADAAHQERYYWVVVRHEIDYLRAVQEGERITARTWAGDEPKGAKFDRHIEFTGEDEKLRVQSRTDWAIIDKAAGRPVRVPPEVIAPFLPRE